MNYSLGQLLQLKLGIEEIEKDLSDMKEVLDRECFCPTTYREKRKDTTGMEDTCLICGKKHNIVRFA